MGHLLGPTAVQLDSAFSLLFQGARELPQGLGQRRWFEELVLHFTASVSVPWADCHQPCWSVVISAASHVAALTCWFIWPFLALAVPCHYGGIRYSEHMGPLLFSVRFPGWKLMVYEVQSGADDRTVPPGFKIHEAMKPIKKSYCICVIVIETKLWSFSQVRVSVLINSSQPPFLTECSTSEELSDKDGERGEGLL